jgi:hypothetical protein
MTLLDEINLAEKSPFSNIYWNSKVGNLGVSPSN